MHRFVSWFILFLLLITSLALSYLYTLNHQDFHHWSFILNSYHDLKNNFDPFKEIYLQYGLGQPVFFLILSKIFSINYLSIGYITATVYSINLFLIYIISKKYLSEHLSLLLIFVIFGLHPYIIYPWPDYFSSLCLTNFPPSNSNFRSEPTSLFSTVIFLIEEFQSNFMKSLTISQTLSGLVLISIFSLTFCLDGPCPSAFLLKEKIKTIKKNNLKKFITHPIV